MALNKSAEVLRLVLKELEIEDQIIEEDNQFIKDVVKDLDRYNVIRLEESYLEIDLKNIRDVDEKGYSTNRSLNSYHIKEIQRYKQSGNFDDLKSRYSIE